MDSIPSPVADRSDEKDHKRESKCVLPCRYSMALLGGFGFVVVFALRVNLSVALVAMVNTTDSSGYTELSSGNKKVSSLCMRE